MTCKITFDPLEVSPKEIKEALGQLPETAKVTFHQGRESNDPKVKESKS